MRNALIIAAALAACVSTADACHRCGRSYCYGCKPVAKSKKLLPYGTNKAKALKAPLAEQGNTLVLKIADAPNLLALFKEYLAGRPLFASAGERNMARAASADQNAYNVLQQINRGQLDERKLLAFGEAFAKGLAQARTDTESRTETTTSTTDIIQPEEPEGIVNPVGPLGAAVSHPFHAIAVANCASCHTGPNGKGKFRVNNRETWDMAEIRRRMDRDTIVGHMPPGKQLGFEQRDLAR